MYIINGRFLTQSVAGVGRFALEMCKALQQEGLQFKLILPKKYRSKEIKTYGFDVVYYGMFDSHLWEQLSLPLFLRTHQNPFLLSFSGLGPVFYSNKAITIHDLSYLYNPKWFSRSYYLLYKYLTPISSRNTKFIITVSQFSKQEITKRLKIKEERIIVLYNGTDFQYQHSVVPEKKYGKYILGVFSLDPRKNFHLLIKAFNQALIPNYKLVLVGKKYANFSGGQVDPQSTSKVVFTGYVTDQELLSLYAGASLFVYPSLYEGFGIPPLEALAMRKNVLVSDIPVFREIFGDAVNYFVNNSIDSLAEKMSILLSSNQQISEDTRTAVLEKYNWNSSAKLLIIRLISHE